MNTQSNFYELKASP